MIGYLVATLAILPLVYLPIRNFIYGPSQPYSTNHPYHHLPFNESLIVPDDDALDCPPHSYTTHILSRQPLVLYIPQFISPSEATHLLEISQNTFSPSLTSSGPNTTTQNPHIRLSTTTTLPLSDPITACITARARALQGFHHDLIIEAPMLQRYTAGGHYVHHYDWAGTGAWDRKSSFLIYVRWDAEEGRGGGTAFPRLKRPVDARWCRWIDCGGDFQAEAETEADAEVEGVVFKPIVGNAVFWENLREDGTGFEETWHAGLPVEAGEKVGLNIWSWYRFG